MLFPISRLLEAAPDVQAGFLVAVIGIFGFMAAQLLTITAGRKNWDSKVRTTLSLCRWLFGLTTIIGFGIARPWGMEQGHPIVWLRHSAAFIVFAMVLGLVGDFSKRSLALIFASAGLLAIHLIGGARLVLIYDDLIDAGPVLADSRPPILIAAAVVAGGLIFALSGLGVLLSAPARARAGATCSFLFALLLCTESTMLNAAIQDRFESSMAVVAEAPSQSLPCVDFASESVAPTEIIEADSNDCAIELEKNQAIGRAAIAGEAGEIADPHPSALKACFAYQ